MYLLFIFIGIFVISTIIFTLAIKKDIICIIEEEGAIFTFIIVMLVSLGGAWAMACGIIQDNLETSMQETSNIQIYSLNNSKELEGNFIFGSGTIHEKIYYYYYIKGDYGYKIDKISADNVEVVEREDEEQIANIITYEKKLVEANNWFAFGKNILKRSSKKIVMYVPRGTIKIIYNISLE